MTCLILKGDLESAENQSHADELSSGSGEDLSGCKSESNEDLLGSHKDSSTQLPPRR
jgi:hypothetical protein